MKHRRKPYREPGQRKPYVKLLIALLMAFSLIAGFFAAYPLMQLFEAITS